MIKEFKNLQSEQLPNDGGWHWSRLIDEANERLGKIGRHGKRAKIKVTPKPGKPISAQFSLPGIGQKSYGLNLSLNKNGLIKAEEICNLITSQLVAGTFTMQWFYSLIGKDKKVIKSEKPLTCGEMLEQYKAHYFKQRKGYKNPFISWKNSYRHIEKTFLEYKDIVLDLKIIKQTIDHTNNNSASRTQLLNGLANLLKFFDNNDFKQVIKRYKSENNPKPKKKYIPSDLEIAFIYETGFEVKPRCARKYRHKYSQWQFLYSLLAIYGLRIHEAWNIKNWDKPVYLKAGDWIAFDDLKNTDEKNEKNEYAYHQIKQNEIIPAILDPNNKDYLLCIGHETKTGYRVAFPISPSGVGRNCDWIKEFNLIQPMNLPDIGNRNPLERGKDKGFNCTKATVDWFNPTTNYAKRNRNSTPNKSTLRYGFTAHALRHAYNLRAHNLGLTPKTIADSLGHGLQMNLNNYMKHEQLDSKIQGIKQEVLNRSQTLSEIEKLQDRIKYLEDENKHLKTELAMYKAIEQSKHK